MVLIQYFLNISEAFEDARSRSVAWTSSWYQALSRKPCPSDIQHARPEIENSFYVKLGTLKQKLIKSRL